MCGQIRLFSHRNSRWAKNPGASCGAIIIIIIIIIIITAVITIITALCLFLMLVFYC